MRRVDPARWAALCAAIRARLEPRLVEVGEQLTGSELSLHTGEEQAAREYRLALDAYMAAGKLLDEAAEPVELAGVSALLDIALTHFAIASARHDGKSAPHRRGRCFYNPLHGPASHTGPDTAHKPRKRQRRYAPSPKGPAVPMCADCRSRAQASLPLDVLPAAVAVRLSRRSRVLRSSRVLVEVPYFVVPHDRSLWSATGYGSLPGTSDADLVKRVMQGEYRHAAKGSHVEISVGKRRWFSRRRK